MLEGLSSIFGNEQQEFSLIIPAIVQRVRGGVIDACSRLPRHMTCFIGIEKVVSWGMYNKAQKNLSWKNRKRSGAGCLCAHRAQTEKQPMKNGMRMPRKVFKIAAADARSTKEME